MDSKGFTIIEIIVMIILIGVLTAIMLPKFLEATDDARIAHAQTSTSAFSEALISFHGAWIAENKPNTTTLDGKTVTFVNGWPHPTTMATADCIDLWDTAFRDAEPMQLYVPNAPAPAWSTLASGPFCIYIYHDNEIYSASNLLPLFVYRPLGDAIDVRRFFM